jgi:hypothetical protein
VLTFNYPIQKDTIYSSLKVKMDDKTSCAVDVTTSSDRKTVYVNAPDDGYESDHSYSMNLSGLYSDGYNTLSGSSKYWFYVYEKEDDSQ